MGANRSIHSRWACPDAIADVRGKALGCSETILE
jgi:hypothetical protein